MNKISILLLCLISVTLFSCSNEEDPKLPEIEPGEFNGNIGPHGYVLRNDKFNERTSTTHFDGENIQFQFNSDSSPTIFEGSIFEVNQILTVNLTDALNTQSYLFFESYSGAMNYLENWISLDWFEQRGDKETENFYTTIKDKQSIRADVVSVDYMGLKVPSLKVKIKGYLYNNENREDSVLIDATFVTQASY